MAASPSIAWRRRRERSRRGHAPAPRQARDTRVTLAHGGGGKAMRDLIDDVFVARFEAALARSRTRPAWPLAALSRPEIGSRSPPTPSWSTRWFSRRRHRHPRGLRHRQRPRGRRRAAALPQLQLHHRGGPRDRAPAPHRRLDAGGGGRGGRAHRDRRHQGRGARARPTSFSSTPPASASSPRAASEPPPGGRGRATSSIVNGVLGDHGAAILAARGDMALARPDPLGLPARSTG